MTSLTTLLSTRRHLLLGSVVVGLSGRGTLRAEESVLLTFEGLYKSFGVLGYEFSDQVRALSGKTVQLVGFMAPPLKAESHFFVLTRQPLSICPFCQSDADWPVDIVVIFMHQATALVSAGRRIKVSGTLEIGSMTDPETGFISQIRLVDASFRAL